MTIPPYSSPLAPHGVFITGTDTGVGKTRVAAALLEGLRMRGIRAVGMKPVAAGCEWVDGQWLNEDAALLAAASGVAAPREWLNPYLLQAPIAPHIAAAREGRRIELAPILSAYKELERLADWVVVEGVGGFRVPLNEHEDTADLAVALGLPVILVVGMRLGCLSHALLTAEAIAARGLSLVGWVANRIDPAMQGYAENRQALQSALKISCLGTVSWQPQNSAGQIAKDLDIEMVLACARQNKAE